MSLKLYKIDLSPPARAVMMICDIFNVKPELIDVDLINKKNLTPEFIKINPLRTIPVLVDGDLILNNSHTIIMYIADKYGKDDVLYPKDLKQRALVNQKLFFNDATLFTRLRNFSFPAFVQGVKGITENQKNDIIEACDWLEAFLTKTKYLAGDNITIADIAAIATVAVYTYIVPLTAEKYPKLTAWINEMEKQPYWEKRSATGAKAIGEFLRNVIAQ